MKIYFIIAERRQEQSTNWFLSFTEILFYSMYVENSVAKNSIVISNFYMLYHT